jgi:putative transposase
MARCLSNVAGCTKQPTLPKSIQGRAKDLIRAMYQSPTRKAALAAYDQFITSYQAKYPRATE